MAVAFLMGCEPEIDTEFNPGSADFSRYIAVGASLTLGQADGGTYQASQEVAFPVLIGQQIQLAAPNASSQFLTPILEGDGTGYLRLAGFTATGAPDLQPVAPNQAVFAGASNFTTDVIPASAISENDIGRFKLRKVEGDFDNFGIPGMRLSSVTSTTYGIDNVNMDPMFTLSSYFDWNPYYNRLLPATEEDKSYLSLIREQDFTFFTCLLGNNDVLQFAASGGAIDITPSATFTQLYTLALDTLTENGAQGVLGTIPSVTSAAYFTAINMEETIATYTAVNELGFYIETEGGARLATANDLILLPASDSLAAVAAGTSTVGASPLNPFPDNLILDSDEVAEVSQAITQYNNTIRSLATQYDLAVADVNALLTDAEDGFTENAVTVTTQYISGDIFSLDGIHLTPR
ncbi:MAG: SGNH/GDSL hydrolase family protein, partial [Bacteroidota bacterium]